MGKAKRLKKMKSARKMAREIVKRQKLASLTFSEWAKSRSPKFQNSILGKNKESILRAVSIAQGIIDNNLSNANRLIQSDVMCDYCKNQYTRYCCNEPKYSCFKGMRAIES